MCTLGVPSARAAITGVCRPRSTPAQPPPSVPSRTRWRAAGWSSAASTFKLMRHRPPRRETVANRIRARPVASIRRSRRVSSWTLTGPIPGRVTDRRPFSPRRIMARSPVFVLEVLFRIRNEPRSWFFFLNLGCPTCLPVRLPRRKSVHAFNALPRSTTASSKTCADTSERQARPVTSNSATPEPSTTKRRPAFSVFFHALNALIRSNPVHGIFTAPSSVPPLDASRAFRCSRRPWLNANRAAPSCRASARACSADGSAVNWNVVCLDTPRTLSAATDTHADVSAGHAGRARVNTPSDARTRPTRPIPPGHIRHLVILGPHPRRPTMLRTPLARVRRRAGRSTSRRRRSRRPRYTTLRDSTHTCGR